MTRLGAVITEAIVQHYGRDEFVRRLASPFWFQSFGAVMGMDWHSSGITTSVLGALTLFALHWHAVFRILRALHRVPEMMRHEFREQVFRCRPG